MPMPVAHGLLGAAVVLAFRPQFILSHEWKYLVAGAALGICPDLDYIPSWFRLFGRGWHHDFTHSIIFSLLLGLAIAFVFNQRSVRASLMYGSAVLSHALLDFCLTATRGVEIFWPFSDERYKLGIENLMESAWRADTHQLSFGDLLRISTLEAIVFLPILFIVLFLKHPKSELQD